ncbi:hypothetical protein EI94DRAFT_1039720 [Lactarius quietus]|nr:hypothetical protein EI94DRAFT_1039720 [Lactarius quietus]
MLKRLLFYCLLNCHVYCLLDLSVRPEQHASRFSHFSCTPGLHASFVNEFSPSFQSPCFLTLLWKRPLIHGQTVNASPPMFTQKPSLLPYMRSHSIPLRTPNIHIPHPVIPFLPNGPPAPCQHQQMTLSIARRRIVKALQEVREMQSTIPLGKRFVSLRRLFKQPFAIKA